MPINTAILRRVLDEYLGSQPHPVATTLTRAEYASFEEAAKLIHGDQVKAPLVEQVAHQLKSAQLSSSEFGRLWQIAQPLSRRMLGRPPSMAEVVHLREQPPAGVSDYYHSHPHPRYPEVTAGEMARWYIAATPIAHQYAQRNPVENEVVRFIKGGYSADEIAGHYGGRVGTQRR